MKDKFCSHIIQEFIKNLFDKKIFLRLFYLFYLASLFISLSGCGSGDDVGGLSSNIKAISDPWKNLQEDSVDPNKVTEKERELIFSDGIAIAYRANTLDGGSLTGNDEICRKEQKNGEALEICLDLTTSLNSPILTRSNLKAIIISEPVISEEGVSCYINGVSSYCGAVYDKIGGDQFNCKSELLNGDKSLSCSDNWAVVVNGEEEDDSKAICRVSLLNNSGKCLAAPVDKIDEEGNQKPPEDLVKEMQNTSWSGYLNKKEGIVNFKQILFDTDTDMKLKAEPLVDHPKIDNVKLNYKSLSVNICTVDNDDDKKNGEKGTITIVGRGKCKIVLKVKVKGYIDKIIHASMEAADKNNATWEGYDNSLFYINETRTPENVQNISGPTLIYKSEYPSICKIGGNGVVEALKVGQCTVKLLIKKQGLLDKVIIKNLTISPLDNQIDGIEFNPVLEGVVGKELVLNKVIGVGGNSDIKYIVTNSGETGCAFKGTTGMALRTLIFENSGVCKIKARVNRGRGYQVWDSSEKQIIVSKGTLDITWGSFQGTLEIGGESKVPSTPTGSGVNGSKITYEIKSGTDANCKLLTPQTGKVKALDVDLSATKKCIITATARKIGYNDNISDIEVTLSAGTLGDIIWGSFQGTLEINGATKTPSTPTGGGATGSSIAYTIKSGYQSNCELVNARTGEVRAKVADLSTTKKCILTVTATKTGYSSSTDIEVTLSAGTLGDITWGSFQGTLEINGATKTPSVPTGGGATGSSIAYTIKSGYQSNCELVNARTGEVRAKVVDLSITKKCILTVTATKLGHNAKTGNIEIILLPGTQDKIIWGNFSGVLEVNGATKIPSAPTGEGATGASIAYTIKSGYQSNCELVNARTGEVRAKVVDLSTTKECILVATAKKVGFTDSISEDIEISLTSGTIIFTGSLSYIGTLAVSGIVNVQTPVTAPLAVIWSYSVIGKRSSMVVDGICDIDTSTGRLEATTTSQAGDICEVTAIARATGYLNKTSNVSITITDLLPLRLTWIGYGQSNSAVFGGNAPTLINPVSNPNGASFSYSIDKSSTINNSCNVNPANGELTINAAGNCGIVATASGVPGRTTVTSMVIVTISKATQSLSWPENPYGNSTDLKIGETLKIVNAPNSGYGNVEYKSITTNTCSALEKTGEITPLDIGNCKIQARYAGDTNYNPSAYVTGFTKTVKKGDITVTSFGDYNSVSVGEKTIAPELVSLSPVASNKSYSTSSNGCKVDKTTGEVTGITDGNNNCQILLTLSFDKYNNLEHTYTISVTKANMSDLVAPVYTTANLKIGGSSTSVQTSPRGAVDGATWSYKIEGVRSGVLASNICSIDNGNGEISLGSDARVGDACRVIATASRAGYNDKDTPAVIFNVIAGDITVSNWGSYASVVVGAGNINAPSITSSPSKVNYSYKKTSSSSGCNVATNGTVTGTDDGTNNCEIKVTITKEGYNPISQVYTISILPGNLKDVIAPVYNADLIIGESAISFATAPSSSDSGVSFVYSAIAKRGTEVVSDVCSVDNRGYVKTLSSAAPGDVCEITAIAKKDGYTDRPAPAVSINIKGKIDITWGGYNPGTFALNITPSLVSPSVSPSDAKLTYSISNSNPDRICLVNSSNGALTTTAKGVCIVKVTATKQNYVSNSKIFSVTINKLSQLPPVINGNPYNIEQGKNYLSGDELEFKSSSINSGYGDIKLIPNDKCAVINQNTKRIVLKKAGTFWSSPAVICNICFRFAGNENYEQSPTTCRDIVEFEKGQIKVSAEENYPTLVQGEKNSVNAPSFAILTHRNLIGGHYYELSSSSRGCDVNNQGKVTIKNDIADSEYGINKCKVSLNIYQSYGSSIKPFRKVYSISIFKSSGNNIYVSRFGNYPQMKYKDVVSAPDISIAYPFSGIEKVYTTASDSQGCSVNVNTGEVTAIAATSGSARCKVKLTISKNGYTTKMHTYEFPISKADMPNTAVFTTPIYPDIRIALSNARYPSFDIVTPPSITGIDDVNLATFSYHNPKKTFRNGILHPHSVYKVSCYDINSNTGAIRIRGSKTRHNTIKAIHGDECYFNVIVKHPNYISKAFEFKVKVLGKMIDFKDLEFTGKLVTLGSYPQLRAVGVGDTISYSGFYVPSGLSGYFGATNSFALDPNSRGCTIDENGNITGVSPGVDTCIVNMTVDVWMKHYSKHPGFKNDVHWIDYEPRTYQFKITVVGSGQIYVRDWGNYPKIGGGFWVYSPPSPTTIPGSVTKKYKFVGNNGYCNWHSNFANNGRVSASSNTKAVCRVKLTISKPGRNSISHIYEVRN